MDRLAQGVRHAVQGPGKACRGSLFGLPGKWAPPAPPSAAELQRGASACGGQNAQRSSLSDCNSSKALISTSLLKCGPSGEASHSPQGPAALPFITANRGFGSGKDDSAEVFWSNRHPVSRKERLVTPCSDTQDVPLRTSHGFPSVQAQLAHPGLPGRASHSRQTITQFGPIHQALLGRWTGQSPVVMLAALPRGEEGEERNRGRGRPRGMRCGRPKP